METKKSGLEKLEKSELIKLLLKQNAKPVLKPRKSVKQMVQEYEENIILPPPQFRDDYKPVPKPRTKKTVSEKPVPKPRTKIEQKNKALKGYVRSIEVAMKSEEDPLEQLQNTRKGIENKLKTLLSEANGFKIVETLTVTFEKTTSKDETTIKTAYFNSNTFTITNENKRNEELQLSKQQITNKIAQ